MNHIRVHIEFQVPYMDDWQEVTPKIRQLIVVVQSIFTIAVGCKDFKFGIEK